VNLVLALGADHQLAAAHGGYEVVDRSAVDSFTEQQELGAVQVLVVIPVVHGLNTQQRRSNRRDIYDVDAGAQGGRREPLEQNGEPKTAGIDHTVLLEHGKQLRRATNRVERGGDRVLERLFEAQTRICRRARSLGRLTQHRENRALNGLANRLERDDHGTLEGRSEQLGIDHLRGIDPLTEPTQNLTEDDTGVATGPHQRPVGHRVTQRLDVGVCGQLAGLRNHDIHRERHIGPGVTVWDGEHVEFVYFFFAFLQRRGRSRDEGHIRCCGHVRRLRLSTGCEL